MTHIELRDTHESDADSIFEMMRDPTSIEMVAFTADDPNDRAAFDAWLGRRMAADDVTLYTVVADGEFAGTAASFAVDDDREVSFWVDRGVWGDRVATKAFRMLLSREPVRPLYGRVAGHNARARAVFEAAAFTELARTPMWAPGVGREVDEVLYVLMPALDGA